MLPGLRAALNYHPIFVHFPIVLWFAALLFELLADDMQRTASSMLYLGTLAAVVAALTGLVAEKSVPPGMAQRVLGIHQALMLVSTSLAAALCIFAFSVRRNFTAQLRKVMLLGLCVLGVLVIFGADRGAQLVYEYGSAVNWSTAEQQK